MGNQSIQKNHSRLGRVVIAERITLEAPLLTPHDYNSWLSKLSLAHGSGIFEPLSHSLSSKHCAGQQLLEMQFPKFQKTLQQQILFRKKRGHPFTQAELWYMIQELLLVLAQLENRTTYAGDIQPSNILLNSQGQLKLITVHSMPHEASNFHKKIKNPKYIALLSPQEASQLLFSSILFDYNKNKSDIFSLGLTIICCASFTDPEALEFLGWTDCQKIGHLLSLIGSYSKEFKQFIAQMLQPDFRRRRTARSLLDTKRFIKSSIAEEKQSSRSTVD